MTIIARPVFPYRPVISSGTIWKSYQKEWNGIRRVPGGICLEDVESPLAKTSQINEYGIVYHKMAFHENDPYPTLSFIAFRNIIDEFLAITEDFYSECDYLGNIEVGAELKNVQNRNLSKDIGNLRETQLPNKLYCAVPEFSVTTPTYYLARDFKNPEHQKSISETLILQILWAFNVPSDNEYIIKEVKKLI